MSIQALVGIIAGVIVVGGGAWYMSTQQGDTGMPSEQVGATDTQAADVPNEGSGTFAELMARTGSWTCDASTAYEGGSSTGTVVMNDGKLRGDFVATMAGITVNTSFIGREGYMYTWTSMIPQGFKVKMEAAAGTAGGQGIDPSTNVTYSCAPWAADESRFTVPADITFMEMNAQGTAGVPLPN